VLGEPLTGVRGATRADQLRIDVRVERERRGGLWR
jgi:hypothetical protein